MWDDVDEGGSGFFRDAVFAFETAFQPDQGGLGMFAGAETGGAEVRASAGKRAGGEVADLHLIVHPAWGLHGEGGEHRVSVVEGFDRVLFLTRPLDAAEDFVLIRGSPVDLTGIVSAPATTAAAHRS
jgi:hypothetical protein